MRKIILNLAVSLDGFIEGPNGEYDWCFTDQDYGMTAFLNRTDSILFGRKSYELMMSLDKNPYPDKKKYVFSNTMNENGGNFTLISGAMINTVKQLKQEQGKDIWLFGGANLTTNLMNEELVDEMMLSIHPILLGNGKPLFSGIHNRFKLNLTDTKIYPNGLVQLFYAL
jgi:dihydrofolate reductase